MSHMTLDEHENWELLPKINEAHTEWIETPVIIRPVNFKVTLTSSVQLHEARLETAERTQTPLPSPHSPLLSMAVSYPADLTPWNSGQYTVKWKQINEMK